MQILEECVPEPGQVLRKGRKCLSKALNGSSMQTVQLISNMING